MRRAEHAVGLLAWGLLTCGAHAGLPPTQSAADEPEKVAFPADDGFWIHADYYGPAAGQDAAPLVILLHTEKSDRHAWKPLSRPLREAGFVILALDTRGSGESATSRTQARAERRDPELFREIHNDLRGAYDWLARQQGVDRARLAIVGAGSGAGVALQYAVTDRSVDVIVCLSPGLNDPGLDPKGDLRQLRGRKILLLATKDEQAACDQLASQTQGVTKRILTGSAHGTDVLGSLPGVEQEIVDFLTRGVGKASRNVVYGSIRSNIYHKAGSGWIAEIHPGNLRHYSSPLEAESRGLRLSKTWGPRQRSPARGARHQQPQPNP